MKLSYEMWCLLLIASIIIVVFLISITDKNFKQLMNKRHKCKECSGDGIVYFNDYPHGFSEQCEHCQGTGKLTL